MKEDQQESSSDINLNDTFEDISSLENRHATMFSPTKNMGLFLIPWDM